MDENFGESVGCETKSDSIVMEKLRAAMDRAHDKFHYTEGPIEILHEKTKFYELAVIQVEGMLQIVEDESDIEDALHEKMLSDLMGTRERISAKIQAMDFSIVTKDRELVQRRANEQKLRQELKTKERELAHLRSSIVELERKKSEGSQDMAGIEAGNEDDEVVEGDICELKSCVDLQVWHIKQTPEDERGNLAGESNNHNNNRSPSNLVDFVSYFKVLNEENHQCLRVKVDDDEHCLESKALIDSSRSDQSAVIERMSSDTDILKETLELAFVKMQNAETRPLEKQWGWMIERDTILVVMDGFMNNLQQQSMNISQGNNEEKEKLTDEKWEQSREEEDDSKLEALIMVETYTAILKGLMEDFKLGLASDAKSQLDDTKSDAAAKSQLGLASDAGEESLIEKLDCWLMCMEMEQDPVQNDSANHDTAVMSESERTDDENKKATNGWFMGDEDEMDLDSAKEKLEKAMQQLVTSKTLLLEMEYAFLPDNDSENVDVQGGGCGAESAYEQAQSYQPMQQDLPRSLFEFQQQLADFEKMVHGKFQRNQSRLEEVKRQLDPLIQLMASPRKTELLYKKAFIQRCHILQLAEAEVDLLGDQVDELLSLL